MLQCLIDGSNAKHIHLEGHACSSEWYKLPAETCDQPQMQSVAVLHDVSHHPWMKDGMTVVASLNSCLRDCMSCAFLFVDPKVFR